MFFYGHLSILEEQKRWCNPVSYTVPQYLLLPALDGWSFPHSNYVSRHFPVIHADYFFHCRPLSSPEPCCWLMGWLWKPYRTCRFHRRYQTLTNEGRCHIDCPNKKQYHHFAGSPGREITSVILIVSAGLFELSWTGHGPAARDKGQTRPRVFSASLLVSRLDLPWLVTLPPMLFVSQSVGFNRWILDFLKAR